MVETGREAMSKQVVHKRKGIERKRESETTGEREGGGA